MKSAGNGGMSDKIGCVSDKTYGVSDSTECVSDTEKGESVSDSIFFLSDTDHSVSDSISPLSDTGYSLSDSISIASDTAASVSDSVDSPSDMALLSSPPGRASTHGSFSLNSKDLLGLPSTEPELPRIQHVGPVYAKDSVDDDFELMMPHLSHGRLVRQRLVLRNPGGGETRSHRW